MRQFSCALVIVCVLLALQGLAAQEKPAQGKSAAKPAASQSAPVNINTILRVVLLRIAISIWRA